MPVSLPVVSSPRFSAGSSAAITDPFPSLPPTPVLYAMARELEALSDATWQPAVPLPSEPPTDARRGNTVFDEASASSPVIASACPQAFASPPRAPRSARARRARTGGDAWPAPTFLSRPSSSRIGRDVFGKLVALGYSREQIRKLKQESLSEIAKYHTTLTGQGFTHADICRISRRRQSLRVVARNYPELAAALPELTRAHIVDIARQRSGDLALQALLPVATALTAAPLRLSASQIATVAQYGERPAIQALYRLRRKLTRAPLHLTPQQVVAIASNTGGKRALEAVCVQLPVLRAAPYRLSTEQVVAIASNKGGKQALEAVKAHLLDLLGAPYVLDTEQVVAIASHNGGKQALEAVKADLLDLRGAPYALSTEQVVAIASHNGGKQALEAVKADLLELRGAPYALSTEQVVAIASHNGGKQALEAVKAHLLDLRGAPYALSTAQVVAIASHNGGKQALEAVKAQLLDLRGAPYALSTAQVVAIASNGGGKQALEGIGEQLRKLRTAPYGLSTEQVVAIASHDGGKQALEAVGAQLVALRAAPYALSTEQVVAIASNHGGKQALEAVRALFRGLRAAPYGLSTAQVVAIASSNGGKQALEAVWALLPVLRATPYDLNTAQVVAIASHDGGKPALEAVWAKLPVLRGVPYALSTAQVVAIACISGQQALEAIEAHMPTLRQAPHSLSPERVAAIACIGGRSAVEAVRQGLPVKAIRRIRREKAPVAGPPPASLGPTPQELVAVLHFFRAHQQPRQAFVDALAAFQTTRPALLRLLSSVGVTEIEALGGTIPDATERWQRLLGRLGFRPATGAAAPSPDSLQGFAQSLERTLGSPGMAGQSACSPHRKRPAETAIAPRSIRRRPNNAGQPSEPWPDQLAWLQRRKRTARSHIRADSAASVPANLHLGTRAQFTPDRLRAEPGPIMQAHTSPASVSFGSHVAFEPGLPDHGTPTPADLASFEAEPFGVGPLDFHLDWLLQILEA
ncbi:hypothetical protein ACI2TJ_12285 [Ralstonia nicotianae]